jgi:hypothetical protein
MACGGEQVAAVPEPQQARVVPATFGEGDTVTIEGMDVSGAITIGRRAATVVSRAGRRARVIVPAGLPTCDNPLPTVTVRAGSESLLVPTLGAPLEAPSRVGEHRIMSTPGQVGCRVRLHTGVYGLALFVPATGIVFSNQIEQRTAFDIRFGGQRQATSSALLTVAPPPATPGTPSDVVTHAQLTSACTRSPLTPGDSVHLLNAGVVADRLRAPNAWYGVRSVSRHFAVVARTEEFMGLSAEEQAVIRDGAARPQYAVIPGPTTPRRPKRNPE